MVKIMDFMHVKWGPLVKYQMLKEPLLMKKQEKQYDQFLV